MRRHRRTPPRHVHRKGGRRLHALAGGHPAACVAPHAHMYACFTCMYMIAAPPRFFPTRVPLSTRCVWVGPAAIWPPALPLIHAYMYALHIYIYIYICEALAPPRFLPTRAPLSVGGGVTAMRGRAAIAARSRRRSRRSLPAPAILLLGATQRAALRRRRRRRFSTPPPLWPWLLQPPARPRSRGAHAPLPPPPAGPAGWPLRPDACPCPPPRTAPSELSRIQGPREDVGQLAA